MRSLLRLVLTGIVTVSLALLGNTAAATDGADHSRNVRLLSNSPRTTAVSQSDLAFWGKLAFAGNYDGFRVLDVADPELVASVELPCGSHTATLAPDPGNGRVIVYSNNSSSSGCGTVPGRPAEDPIGDFIDVVEVPVAHPADANLLRREPLTGPLTDIRTGCHDMGVILGDVNLAACASADATNVYDVGANDHPGGSLADPEFLYTVSEPGVGQAGTNGRWHSAAFTWDGEVLVLGWEPGGGAEGECESTDPAVDKSAFFYDADTGAKLGQWTLPRAQDGTVVDGVPIAENCTIHNYNIVPLRSGRYLMAGGHYQAGTWATDFTDPAHPVALGFSDPPPLVRQTPAGPAAELGGAWSSYWYNNHLYESSITEGLNVLRLSAPEAGGALRLARLNPQTQDFSIG